MSCRKLSNELQAVDCPSISTPLYRSCLSEVLQHQPKSKRERIMSLVESGCDVLVNNRIVVTGVGVTLTVALVFVGTWGPFGTNINNGQVQAQEIVEELEIAAVDLDEDKRALIENQTNNSFDVLIEEAKAAKVALVYDLDPNIPMRVVDSRANVTQSYVVTFVEDDRGHLQAKSMIPHIVDSQSTMSAEQKRRILQYANSQGEIIMLDLNERNQPRSGIVLAGN